MTWLKYIWVWLKGLLGLQDASDLLWLMLHKLITPEMQDVLIELVKEAGRLDTTPELKKKYVLSQLANLKTQVGKDAVLLKGQVVSMAINLIVEYLQLHGELASNPAKNIVSSGTVQNHK